MKYLQKSLLIVIGTLGVLGGGAGLATKMGFDSVATVFMAALFPFVLPGAVVAMLIFGVHGDITGLGMGVTIVGVSIPIDVVLLYAYLRWNARRQSRVSQGSDLE